MRWESTAILAEPRVISRRSARRPSRRFPDRCSLSELPVLIARGASQKPYAPLLRLHAAIALNVWTPSLLMSLHNRLPRVLPGDIVRVIDGCPMDTRRAAPGMADLEGRIHL